MLRQSFLPIMFALLSVRGCGQDLKLASGKVVRHANFRSAFVAARNVDVWLPEGYTPRKRYAVLYMHDGQMLFDSTTTWNRKEWGVDETAGQLLRKKKIRDCIVVGIWNTGAGRHADYFPQKPFENLPHNVQDSFYGTNRSKGQSVFNGQIVRSDVYLRFVVSELKPFIDSAYSTHTDQRNTFIAGSSMGGLISLYALCEYPAVFGGAACLSTHWPGVFSMDNNPIPEVFVRYLQNSLPNPGTHRIYFDYGDATLDAWYPALQVKVDSVMTQRGYSEKNWITKYFPGAAHSETAWAQRLHVPLEFLLANRHEKGRR